MDPPKEQQKNHDIEAQMIQDLQLLRNQNQYLKSQKDRLQKLLDEITCSNDNQRICQCGSKLRYMSAEMGPCEKNCSKCQKKVGYESRVWWACQKCDYYTCVHCQGYKKSICPFSHFLQYKKLNLDIQKQQQLQQAVEQLKQFSRSRSKAKKQCDICMESITSNFYVCTCGFDMCQTCRNK